MNKYTQKVVVEYSIFLGIGYVLGPRIRNIWLDFLDQFFHFSIIER